MKLIRRITVAALVAGLALTTVYAQTARKPAAGIPPAITTPDKIETRIGTLEFKDGAPSKETADKVRDSVDFARAVDAFMNSFSGASAYAIREGFSSVGAEDNSILIFPS